MCLYQRAFRNKVKGRRGSFEGRWALRRVGGAGEKRVMEDKPAWSQFTHLSRWVNGSDAHFQSVLKGLVLVNLGITQLLLNWRNKWGHLCIYNQERLIPETFNQFKIDLYFSSYTNFSHHNVKHLCLFNSICIGSCIDFSWSRTGFLFHSVFLLQIALLMMPQMYLFIPSKRPQDGIWTKAVSPWLKKGIFRWSVITKSWLRFHTSCAEKLSQNWHIWAIKEPHFGWFPVQNLKNQIWLNQFWLMT